MFTECLTQPKSNRLPGGQDGMSRGRNLYCTSVSKIYIANAYFSNEIRARIEYDTVGMHVNDIEDSNFNWNNFQLKNVLLEYCTF